MKKSTGLILLTACLVFTGCASSRMALIKTNPPGADVQVNNNHVGKSPTSYRFVDNWWDSWSGTDDYTVQVQLKGYKSDVRVLKDTSSFDVEDYVPDVIFFELIPEGQ